MSEDAPHQLTQVHCSPLPPTLPAFAQDPGQKLSAHSLQSLQRLLVCSAQLRTPQHDSAQGCLLLHSIPMLIASRVPFLQHQDPAEPPRSCAENTAMRCSQEHTAAYGLLLPRQSQDTHPIPKLSSSSSKMVGWFPPSSFDVQSLISASEYSG